MLDDTTYQIDVNAIEHFSRQIELLEEYRTRLIANVVTGKLDVREAAERLPEDPGGDGLTDDDGFIMDNLGDDYDASQPPETEKEAIP